jgi:hypothetical protein
VILQDQSSQAALLRQPRDLEGVSLAWVAVGIVMGMQVDATDDRWICQMLIRLWRRRLPPVSLPVRLIALRRRLLRRE